MAAAAAAAAAANGSTASSLSLLPFLSKFLPQDRLKEWKDLDLPVSFPQKGADEAFLDEAKHWLEFAGGFQEGDGWSRKLKELDDHLFKQSVILGHGMTISPVDVTVFAAVRDTVVHHVITMPKVAYQNVLRWFDYVQNEEKVAVFCNNIPIAKGGFEPQDFSDAIIKKPLKAEAAAGVEPNKGNSKDAAKSTEKDIDSGDKANDNKGKKATQKKEEIKEQKRNEDMESMKKEEKKDKEHDKSAKKEEKKDNEVNTSAKKKEKKEKEDNSSSKKEGEGKKDENKGKEETQVNVSVLDIRVGQVIKVWKHPSADSLFVEEIDLGDVGVRQVVSGLAKYMKEEDMMNRKVVLIANVKPGKLRDVVSAGLVLCASNADHTLVEPLLPPPAAVVGERVMFLGYDGKPEEVLNPKKKQLEKIFPDLLTDDNGVATYQGIPFMTSAGPCTSSISKAPIK